MSVERSTVAHILPSAPPAEGGRVLAMTWSIDNGAGEIKWVRVLRYRGGLVDVVYDATATSWGVDDLRHRIDAAIRAPIWDNLCRMYRGRRSAAKGGEDSTDMAPMLLWT